MAEFLFPWERQAMHGEEMPGGLSLADQAAYTALRNIYWLYHKKYLSREKAAREKQKIRLNYVMALEKEKNQDSVMAYHVKLTKRIEGAICNCRKNPSAENAIRLCDVIDGFWRGETQI